MRLCSSGMGPAFGKDLLAHEGSKVVVLAPATLDLTNAAYLFKAFVARHHGPALVHLLMCPVHSPPHPASGARTYEHKAMVVRDAKHTFKVRWHRGTYWLCRFAPCSGFCAVADCHCATQRNQRTDA